MTNFGLATYAAIGERVNSVEFDCPFVLTATGDVIENAEGVYAPDAVNGSYSFEAPRDVEVSDGWECVTYGLSGQHDYRGGVMHPSEFIGGGIARHLMDLVEAHEDADQVFAVVEVRDEDGAYPDGDPLGWTIVRYTGEDA